MVREPHRKKRCLGSRIEEGGALEVAARVTKARAGLGPGAGPISPEQRVRS